jgi:hypothetical protein
MHRFGFESMNPVFESAKTIDALDGTATVIGFAISMVIINLYLLAATSYIVLFVYFIDNQILQSLSQCTGLCTIYELFIVHSS